MSNCCASPLCRTLRGVAFLAICWLAIKGIFYPYSLTDYGFDWLGFSLGTFAIVTALYGSVAYKRQKKCALTLFTIVQAILLLASLFYLTQTLTWFFGEFMGENSLAWLFALLWLPFTVSYFTLVNKSIILSVRARSEIACKNVIPVALPAVEMQPAVVPTVIPAAPAMEAVQPAYYPFAPGMMPMMPMMPMPAPGTQQAQIAQPMAMPYHPMYPYPFYPQPQLAWVPPPATQQ